MRFMILGSGMQGRACAYDMLKNPEVEEVLLADSSLASLEHATTWLHSPRVRHLVVDARDAAAVAEAARGYDVVVSAVPYYLNLPLCEAVMEAGVSWIDLGGNTDIVREELAFDERAVEKNVTLQPDVGLGPGMINIFAAHGIEQMDEVDEVLIRDGGLPRHPVPPMNYTLTFSEHGLINEYVSPATAVRDFKRVEVPGLSETEIIDLPEPLGRCEAAHASGGLSTMAWTYEGRVRFMDNKLIRYPGHIAVINAMHAMGFFDTHPIKVGNVEIAPRDMSARLFRRAFEAPKAADLVVIRVTVRGSKNGQPLELVYEMMDFYDEVNHITAMARTTGFPASIVAQMIVRGDMRPGALPVELGVPGDRFIEEIRARGFNVTITRRGGDAG